MSVIKALDKNTVHHICSGQVIVSLANAVKELIENSLDAGAKSIEVRLKNFGADSIEVIDDGPGVEEAEFQTITLKHYTSKIQCYDDLESLGTFGFRGEALNSLCALSEMTITTRHVNAVTASRLEYDTCGLIKNRKPCARSVGTTVVIERLFYSLPVRYKEFTKNVKKEYSKLLHVIQSYCLISDSIKLSCFNFSGNKSSKIMSTHSKNSLKDNIIEIFGIASFNNMLKFEQSEPSDDLKGEFKVSASTKNCDENSESMFSVVGYISNCSHGVGRSAPDRQHLYVNKRPCDNTRINKLVNEIFHQFNRTQYPMFVLNVNLNSRNVDVNVTPDKLQMFIRNESLLLAILKASLLGMYQASFQTLSYANSSLNSSVKNFFTVSQPKASGLKSQSESEFASESENEKENKKENKKENRLGCDKVEEDSVEELHQRQTRKRQASESIDEDYTPENDCTPKKAKEVTNYEAITESCPKFKQPKLDIYQVSNAKESVVKASNIEILKKKKIVEEIESEDEARIVDRKKMPEKSIANMLFQSNIGSNVHLNDSGGTPIKKVTNLDDSLAVRLDIHYGNYEDLMETDDENATQLNEACVVPVAKKMKKFSAGKKDHDLEICEKESATKAVQSQSSIVASQSTVTENCDQDDEEDDRVDDTQKKIDAISRRKSKNIEFSIDILRKRMQSVKMSENDKPKTLNIKFKAKNLTSKDAESDLDKGITKEDFLKMNVCGQFNKGFIIARLENDLFIVDQHAADEIYNFETLQKNPKIQRQRLLHPHYLELSAASESILLDNLELLEKAGYEINVVNNRKIGNRIMLTCVPVSSKPGNLLDLQDIDEILFILNASDLNPSSMYADCMDDTVKKVNIKPSSLRAMYASKACRKAVMVGDSLNKFEMKRIVNHLSEISKPWNCPHGRPTLRHLINLDLIKSVS